MRTRSQGRSRSLADLPAGFGCASGSGAGAGSEGMMTRGRCRRLRAANQLAACAGSEAIATDLSAAAAPTNHYQSRYCWEVEAGRPTKKHTARFRGGQTEAAAESEWRDWANLPSELIEDIAGRLLSVDVSEYLRFRCACKPWREYTEEPGRSCRSGLDRRFRPRNWIAISHCASPSRRSLVNVSTGVRVEVDHPELSAHHYLGVADGLLVLCHKTSNAIGLFNPFTGAITHFPPIRDVRATAPQYDASTRVMRAFYSKKSRTEEDTRIITEALKVDIPESDDPSIVNGAGIDDSTSLPTLVLGLRRGVNRIICAKPGDQHWVSVHYGEQKYSLCNWNDRVSFHSLLSFGGHCYVATAWGDLMMVDLCPRTAKGPWMVYVSRVTVLDCGIYVYSYLIRSLDERMLMLRFLSSREDFSRDHYEQTEMFTLNGGIFSRMELLEVDFTRRQLIPLRGIGGNYAAFVGATYTVMLSADKFPKLAADAVYFNCFLQRWWHLGIYHFKDKRISPPKDVRPDACPGGSAHPCACHWELDDYLVRDIEKGYSI